VTSVAEFEEEEEVVYDQNLYFSFGSIQKLKPIKADNFWPKPHFKGKILLTGSTGYFFSS
jgi:hypothetical protein